jgi:hypothetical protein
MPERKGKLAILTIVCGEELKNTRKTLMKMNPSISL